jgi:hypothetical protein
VNIELKNVKYAAFASEETSCFQATVYVNGKKAGDVSNDGHGGCHRWDPWELQKQLDEHAKQTLPVEVTEWDDPKKPGEKFVFQPDADHIIDKLLTQHLVAKDLKRALAKKVLFLKDGKIMETRSYTAAELQGLLAVPVRLAGYLTTDQESILNLMPFEAALAIYMGAK